MSTGRQRVQRWFGVGLAIAVGGVCVGSLSSSWARSIPPVVQSTSNAPSTSPVTENLLVSIRREGGFCMVQGCFSEVAIFTDGTYRYSTHTSNPIAGRISDGELQRLQEQINQVEPGQLYAQPPFPQPIDDFCGLAFDGPEVIYTFPKGEHLQQVRGCDRAIAPNHPLVQQLERLYSQISEQATQYPSVQLNPNEPLPRSVSNRVQRTFLRDYGNHLTNIQVLRSEAVLWTDCVPNVASGHALNRSCEPSPRTGWQVTLTGELPGFEQPITRVYYADRQAALMDRTESLSEEARSHLAESLNIPLAQLQIMAAEEVDPTACVGRGACPTPPQNLSWRVLVQQGLNEKVLHVTDLGTPPEGNLDFFSEADRNVLGSLPLAIANAVVRDAQDRFQAEALAGTPGSTEVNLQVKSIKPVSWNLCHGGEGPTRPAMGTCPDITLTGWQMIVQGGQEPEPLQFVYYIPSDAAQAAEAFVPVPDGLQSLPQAVQTNIRETVAAQLGIPVSQLSIHWADARLFDGCLSAIADAVRCRNDVRPGWRVEVMGSQPRPGEGWGSPVWIYHTNLRGTDLQLITEGVWAPPPVAPPAPL